jgi:hypothetical protein
VPLEQAVPTDSPFEVEAVSSKRVWRKAVGFMLGLILKGKGAVLSGQF